MEIVVYGKKDCGKCEAAKDKLNRMGLPYMSRELEKYTTLHDGWRSDGSVRILAESVYLGETLPILSIDGQFFDYPTSMKFLKRLRKESRSEVSSKEAVLV